MHRARVLSPVVTIVFLIKNRFAICLFIKGVILKENPLLAWSLKMPLPEHTKQSHHLSRNKLSLLSIV